MLGVNEQRCNNPSKHENTEVSMYVCIPASVLNHFVFRQAMRRTTQDVLGCEMRIRLVDENEQRYGCKKSDGAYFQHQTMNGFTSKQRWWQLVQKINSYSFIVHNQTFFIQFFRNKSPTSKTNAISSLFFTMSE